MYGRSASHHTMDPASHCAGTTPNYAQASLSQTGGPFAHELGGHKIRRRCLQHGHWQRWHVSRLSTAKNFVQSAVLVDRLRVSR
jgi:hypothetical protein